MGLEWQVIADGQSWLPWLNRDKFPKEFAIPECDSARSIHFDQVLVELADFDDEAGFVPFGGIGSSLIL